MLIRQNRGGAETASENAPPLPPLVCVLDDDPDIRGSIESLLRSEGFSVQTYASTSEFVMCESVDRAACLLLDINLGDANGLDFPDELAGNEIPVPVILMSGYGDIPMTVRGMRAGALDFLAKPLSDDVLLAAVSDAIRKDEVRRAASAALDGTRQRYNAPWWVHLLVSLPLITVPCVLALRPIKGWLVASQYVNRAQEAGTEVSWRDLNARARERRAGSLRAPKRRR